jgi:hypothetical protein
MENQISTSKLVAPSVVSEESDVPSADTNLTSSIKALHPYQNQKSSVKKAPPSKHKILSKEAQNLPFDVYDAYDKPVILSELLDEVSRTIRIFVIVEKVHADAAALWILHTYVVGYFDTSPIFIINAPERACAKTLFQTVLAYLAARALMASNATASSLFRSIDLWQPTIFFDEADTFFKDNNDLLGMVNAGYKASGFVLRSEAVDDSFVPRKFPVFGAKSIAGIALERHLPDSTMSRGIVINMRRKLPDETVTRLRYAEPGLFARLCAKLERAADDYAEAIQQVRPHLPDALSDRAQDNWEPLLAIAEVAGDGWLERATQAALILSNQSNEKVSTGNELLSDIQSIFDERAHGKKNWDKISSSELITELEHIPESPWATYNQGRPIAPRQLASQLAVYGIKSKTVRLGPHDTPKGYELSQFEDAFARYLNAADASVPEAVQYEDTSLDTPTPSDARLY